MTVKRIVVPLSDPPPPRYAVPVHIAVIGSPERIYCGVKDWMLRIAHPSRHSEATCPACFDAMEQAKQQAERERERSKGIGF